MIDYKMLQKQVEALTGDCPYLISNLANTAALIWNYMENINWAGFYELRGDQLILGPFQGKPACVQIPEGSGVCGTAVQEKMVKRVENVHTFPGHIACDSASASEIVVPLHKSGEIWGVLDIDSPEIARFQEEDQQGLQSVCQAIESFLETSRP